MPLLLLLGVLVTVITGLLPFSAHAGAGNFATACSNDGTLYGVFCNIGNQLRYLPKTLVTFCYVMAAVLAMVGLLNLKAYGDDPTSVPIRTIIMKFILAAFLISLPSAIQVFVTSVTGTKNIEQNEAIGGRPCLMRSNLSSLRTTNGPGGGNSPCN
jgi:hypothetical protein